jgi:hypothetical protein
LSRYGNPILSNVPSRPLERIMSKSPGQEIDETNDMARLAPPAPEMTALVEALQDNTAETRRFLGVISGTVPIADSFTPDSIGRIMGSELAA